MNTAGTDRPGGTSARRIAVIDRTTELSDDEELVDSGLEMADRLVYVQYQFIRKVVDSAGRSLSTDGDVEVKRRRVIQRLQQPADRSASA